MCSFDGQQFEFLAIPCQCVFVVIYEPIRFEICNHCILINFFNNFCSRCGNCCAVDRTTPAGSASVNQDSSFRSYALFIMSTIPTSVRDTTPTTTKQAPVSSKPTVIELKRHGPLGGSPAGSPVASSSKSKPEWSREQATASNMPLNPTGSYLNSVTTPLLSQRDHIQFTIQTTFEVEATPEFTTLKVPTSMRAFIL